MLELIKHVCDVWKQNIGLLNWMRHGAFEKKWVHPGDRTFLHMDFTQGLASVSDWFRTMVEPEWDGRVRKGVAPLAIDFGPAHGQHVAMTSHHWGNYGGKFLCPCQVTEGGRQLSGYCLIAVGTFNQLASL